MRANLQEKAQLTIKSRQTGSSRRWGIPLVVRFIRSIDKTLIQPDKPTRKSSVDKAAEKRHGGVGLAAGAGLATGEGLATRGPRPAADPAIGGRACGRGPWSLPQPAGRAKWVAPDGQTGKSCYFWTSAPFFTSSLLFFPNSPYLCSPYMRSSRSLAEGPSLAVHRRWVIFRRNSAPVHQIELLC